MSNKKQINYKPRPRRENNRGRQETEIGDLPVRCLPEHCSQSGAQAGIPEGWEVVSLGQVADITSSKRIFASEYQDSGIPFYRGKEIIEKHDGKLVTNELFIDEGKYLEIQEKFGVPQENDILLTSVGTLGTPYRVAKHDRFYFKDGNVTWFREIDEATSKYLYCWLNSSWGKRRLIEKSIGSTQQALTIEALKSVTLALPPKQERQCISSIISSLDDKIELNRKINRTLEEMGKALFKHWFVDFEFPDEEGKPYKSSGGEMVESELGEIPNGWEVVQLKNVCKLIINGGTPSRSNDLFWENGSIRWLKSKELNNSILVDTEEKITELGLSKSSAKILPLNSVVIALYGATVGQIGVLKEKMTTNQACTALISGDNYSYSFIYFYLLRNQKDIFNLARGAAQQNISKGIVESLPIVKPLTKIVEKCKIIFESTLDKIEANTREIQSLENARDSLLPRLMSGRIRV